MLRSRCPIARACRLQFVCSLVPGSSLYLVSRFGDHHQPKFVLAHLLHGLAACSEGQEEYPRQKSLVRDQDKNACASRHSTGAAAHRLRRKFCPFGTSPTSVCIQHLDTQSPTSPVLHAGQIRESGTNVPPNLRRSSRACAACRFVPFFVENQPCGHKILAALHPLF